MEPSQSIVTFVLVLARVSAFVAFFPLFGQRQLPLLVKSGLATGLTVFWYGTLPEDWLEVRSFNALVATFLVAKEIGIGFILASVLGFFFIPARIAGAYIGQEIGLSLASVTSPGTADSSTLVTTIFETICVLMFFGLNIHHFMIMFVHVSLTTLAGKIDLTNLPFEMVTEATQIVSECGGLIIAPVGICMFMLTIGLALLNRAAPSLNLFSVGMSLRSGLGLLCMFVFMPVIIKSLAMYFYRYASDLEIFATYFL